MVSTSRELAQGLYDVLISAPERSDEIIKKFADAITSAGLSSYIERITDEMMNISEEASGDTTIRGRVAHDLKMEGVQAEKDPRLIAGAVLGRGGYVADTSIKSRLAVIKNSVNA